MARGPINPFLTAGLTKDAVEEAKLKVGRKPLPEEERHQSTKEERGDDSKDPVQFVSLSGVGLTESGEFVERNFLTALEKYVGANNDMVISRDDAIKLQRYMSGLSTGACAVVPYLCVAEKCPSKDLCPFMTGQLDSPPPLGRQCPIEVGLIKEKKKAYIEEFQIPLNAHVDLSLIDDLVSIDIRMLRLHAQMAKERDSGLITEEVINHDREGEPVYTRRSSPALDVEEKLWAKKARILGMMVGDRREKYKQQVAIGQREEDNAATQWANARATLAKLAKDAGKVIDMDDAVAASNAKLVNALEE